MKHRYLIVLVAIAVIALAPTTQARANMAPPSFPAGGSLDAGEPPTYVQMVSENVLMTIGDKNADVKATFNMLNTGTEVETLNVRFPVGVRWIDDEGNEGGATGVDLDSFTVYVDGRKTNFTTTKSASDSLFWTTWEVTFPPEQIVKVEASYLGYAEPDDNSFLMYSYILETGAGWYGTIGEGTVTFRLPYEINPITVLETEFPFQPDYYTIAGTDIIWHFTDLEPTGDDNLYVDVMPPPVWRKWQEAEKAVEQNPDSVSAHLQLAHALHDAICWRGGGYYGSPELFDRAMLEYNLWLNVIPDAYVREVIPNIVDYHLEFLEMLRFGFGPVWVSPCQELKRVSAIAPTDKRIVEMKDSLEQWCSYETTPEPTATLYSPLGCNPRAGRCPPPTATSTVTPVTPNPTSTPRPTQTPTVPPTQTATPTPNPQPPTPSLTLATLVGIAAVVIAGAGVGMWAARRKARPAGD